MDYGFSEILPIKNAFPIKNSFLSTREACIQIELACIELKQGVSLAKAFRDIVENSTHFIAHVYKVNANVMQVYLFSISKANKKQTFVNDLLVEKGYARLIEN